MGIEMSNFAGSTNVHSAIATSANSKAIAPISPRLKWALEVRGTFSFRSCLAIPIIHALRKTDPIESQISCAGMCLSRIKLPLPVTDRPRRPQFLSARNHFRDTPIERDRIQKAGRGRRHDVVVSGVAQD